MEIDRGQIGNNGRALSGSMAVGSAGGVSIGNVSAFDEHRLNLDIVSKNTRAVQRGSGEGRSEANFLRNESLSERANRMMMEMRGKLVEREPARGARDQFSDIATNGPLPSLRRGQITASPKREHAHSSRSMD